MSSAGARLAPGEEPEPGARIINAVVQAAKREAVRPGTILLALALVAGVATGGAYAALARYDLVGLGHLPRVAVFALVLLLLVNGVAGVLRRRHIFSRAQMAFVYIAILVMAGFPGQQLVTYLYLGMLGPAYYATPENRYEQTFFPYIPDWMVPSKNRDAPVIRWAFEGMPAGASIPWRPWVKPLLAWTPYLLALLMLQLCVAVLLRRRWAEEEQLTFPLARIPVEIVSYRTPSDAWPVPFRKWAFWIAFAVPVSVQSLYALHQYFPQLPHVDLNRDIGSPFGQRPWHLLNGLPYPVYFGVVGVTCLIPTDIGFSLWFFWLVRRFIAVGRSALGYEPHEPFFTDHGIGAYVFLAVIYLWMARASLIRAARSLFVRPAASEPEEPLPIRFATLGCLASIAVVVAWGWIAGARPWAVFLMLTLHLAAIIVLSRLVSEAGILVVWTAIWSPQIPVVRALGLEAVGPRTVTITSFLGWKLHDSASCTMASVLQGYRIGGLVRARPNSVFWLSAAALAAALFASHPASLATIYHFGVPKLGWWPRGAASLLPNTINNLLTSPTTYKFGEYAYMLSGGAVVGGLQMLRLRFPPFPLSPLGYAFVMGPQFASDRYGFSIFLGWVLKAAVVRGGGRKAFEVLRFAALGIIVGDAVVLSLWTVARYLFPLGEALIIE